MKERESVRQHQLREGHESEPDSATHPRVNAARRQALAHILGHKVQQRSRHLSPEGPRALLRLLRELHRRADDLEAALAQREPRDKVVAAPHVDLARVEAHDGPPLEVLQRVKVGAQPHEVGL